MLVSTPRLVIADVARADAVLSEVGSQAPGNKLQLSTLCFNLTNVPGRVITEVASFVSETIPRVISVAVVASVGTTSSGEIQL